MLRYAFLSFTIIFCVDVSSQITPEIYSWILNTSGETGYDNFPSNVQQVQYSDDNVYVSCTCIPGYDIGPWFGNPNTPENQNFVFKITRHPEENTGTSINTPMGHIGLFSNGVSIFNPLDGMSYNNQNVWHQNAVVVEGISFDDCLGHPAPNGEYHHHLNPTCLYDDELTSEHSPIIGYAFDGFPVYGAFGFANPDGSGGIKRMESSYHKRDILTRTTLPDGSTAASAGPAVSTDYPLGYYIEDFEYIEGSGDLDEHNGRFGVTPDYPDGIYCYYVTLDSTFTAEYPYLIGPNYFGTVQTGNTGPGSGHNTISETVTTYNGTNNLAEEPGEIKPDIFPNPASDVLNVYIPENMPNNIELELIDGKGSVIYTARNLQPTILYSFDVKELTTGAYVARLTAGDAAGFKRFIVEKL